VFDQLHEQDHGDSKGELSKAVIDRSIGVPSHLTEVR